MLKEMFQNREAKPEESKRAVVVVNPNVVPQVSLPEEQKEETIEPKNEEVKIVNFIISSEALEDGTFRYTLISNKIYSIGTIEVNQ